MLQTYTLPSHKAPAPLLPAFADDDNHGAQGAMAPLILHSPISPLSPSSPIFPDGIITPIWATKHQKIVPAVFVNFFPLTVDFNSASLRDNQLKIEINSLRKDWAASGYKARFAVGLVFEDGPAPEDANERVTGIRRATNMDAKSVFVLPPNATALEIRDFVKSLFTSLQGPSMDYYRDLSKHARRKRNRSVIPAPTAPPTNGTSMTLSSQGWNIRYEFKLGVFAEFRQEMEAAFRSYEIAYELLFGDEVFGSIAPWSPRFNDTRMLADVLAIRLTRCLLWTDQTAAALNLWETHRARMQHLIDRRGKGTNTYGWEAWESRWSFLMAELVERAGILSFAAGRTDPVHGSQGLSPFMPERSFFTGGESPPWHLLHHKGYWLRLAAKHSEKRRLLAEEIPHEDREEPDHSNTRQRNHIRNTYDTYLAPEPYEEYPLSNAARSTHSKLIIQSLEESIREFAIRGQTRFVESLSYGIAKEYIRMGRWDHALDILRPLWPGLSWRKEGWWLLMEGFGWTLRRCAAECGDLATVLQVDWELMNSSKQTLSQSLCRYSSFTYAYILTGFSIQPGWVYDIHKSFDNSPGSKSKTAVVLKKEEVISCSSSNTLPSLWSQLTRYIVSASFLFLNSEGSVGEPLQCQLILQSHAHKISSPLRLSAIEVLFEDGIRPLRIIDNGERPRSFATRCETYRISLRDISASPTESRLGNLSPMVGEANLSFSPGQIKALDITTIPREAGEARVVSIKLMVEADIYKITYVVTDQSPMSGIWWDHSRDGVLARRVGKDRDTSSCHVLPKLPRIRITSPNLLRQYYTNEKIVVDIRVDNEEEEAVDLLVEMKLHGTSEALPTISWFHEWMAEYSQGGADTSKLPLNNQELRRSIGILAPGEGTVLSTLLTDTSMPLDYKLEITTLYHTITDAETQMSKSISLDMSFSRPFDVKYDFRPRVHATPWPDFFNPQDTQDGGEEGEDAVHKLLQRWCLDYKVISFSQEPLIIEDVHLVPTAISGGEVRSISSEGKSHPSAPPRIALKQPHESSFTVDIQRSTVYDTQPTSLDLTLNIRWRRDVEYDGQLRPGVEVTEITKDAEFTRSMAEMETALPISRFVTPMGEPRVLASATKSKALPGFIHVEYTLENPSLHFLTFKFIMEANDQFSFNGPKSLILQLVPLSRHTVHYNMLTKKKGGQIRPQLVVMDTYFNKALRILPTGNVNGDKKGLLLNWTA